VQTLCNWENNSNQRELVGTEQYEPARYCRRLNILREYDNKKIKLYSWD